jgi:hypothetical protein
MHQIAYRLLGTTGQIWWKETGRQKMFMEHYSEITTLNILVCKWLSLSVFAVESSLCPKDLKQYYVKILPLIKLIYYNKWSLSGYIMILP